MAGPAVDQLRSDLDRAVTGRYSLERELGRGGMGAVFLARDIALDRLVAIKLLPPELAVRPELRERFLRETRTAASFSHPNIVPVHAVEETPALLFFVMGYVEGETLTQRIRRQGPLPQADAVRLLQEVAWALSYAHSRGVIHRDIKPDNILLERATGRALVTDFGIARSVAVSGLTQVGETVGTPHFMSPEQAAGDTLDGRSDLYALGVVGYFAVTGRLPFDAESAQAILAMHLSQTARPIASFRPDLPASLVGAIERCLAKDPALRFANGEALVEALDASRSKTAVVAPPIRMFVSKADMFLRNGIVLALLSWQIILRLDSELDQLVFTAMFATAVLALWSQVPQGMRDLARQGFSFRDLQEGIAAVDQEHEATRAALRAAPNAAKRARRRWIIMLGLALLSAGLFAFAFSQRRRIEDHYAVTVPGVIALFIGVCLGMGTLVSAVAAKSRAGKLDRRLHQLWIGPVGAWLYRVASRGVYANEGGAAMGTPSRHGALTLLDTLVGEPKKQLSKARAGLERLEAEVERLGRREKELEAAIVEAKADAPTLPSGPNGRQQALVDDLERARREALDRRVLILGSLENVRLAMLRVKSGIGGVAAVEKELEAAASLGLDRLAGALGN